MKARAHFIGRTIIPLLGLGLLSVTFASAGPTNPPAKPAPPTKGALATPAPAAATNAVVEIPKSVFVIPTNAAHGKDPFFPSSLYPYGTSAVATKTNTPAAVIPELSLTGISGSADNPLAIISNRTFGVGDVGEVVLGTKRIGIHVLEINLTSGTAVVQVGGQRRTLQLKQGK